MEGENFEGVLLEKTSSRELRFPFKVQPEWIDRNNHVGQLYLDEVFVDAQADLVKEFKIDALPHEIEQFERCTMFLKKKELEFFAEMKSGDSGEVTTIARPGTTSVTFMQRIYNQRRELVAEATYVAVLVDTETGKPAPLPQKSKDPFFS
jgi:acyl-CoA thioesterase FadM